MLEELGKKKKSREAGKRRHIVTPKEKSKQQWSTGRKDEFAGVEAARVAQAEKNWKQMKGR